MAAGRAPLGLALLGALAIAGVTLTPWSRAGFVASDLSGGSVTTDLLEPPTNLAAAGGVEASLSWTPTVDTYAAGYRVERAPSLLGPWSSVGTVTPSSAAAAVDQPGPGLHAYRLRSYVASWSSVPTAEVLALVTGSGWRACTSQAAAAGGNNDGFEVGAVNACLVGPPAAMDMASGTNNNNSCTNAGKDRHRFWDFSLGIPATATSIDGIEVRLDHAVSNTSGVNRMCVRLSWNGGTSWTAAQQVNIASTSIVSAVLGGPADTWGRTWTGAQLSDANLRVEVTNVANQSGKDFTLESVAVNVTYTP